MPWWGIIIFVLWCVISFGGLYDDAQDGKPIWHLLATFASSLTIACFVVGFWRTDWVLMIGAAGPIVYVLSLIWEVMLLMEDRRALRDEAAESVQYSKPANLIAFIAMAPALVLSGGTLVKISGAL